MPTAIQKQNPVCILCKKEARTSWGIKYDSKAFLYPTDYDGLEQLRESLYAKTQGEFYSYFVAEESQKVVCFSCAEEHYKSIQEIMIENGVE